MTQPDKARESAYGRTYDIPGWESATFKSVTNILNRQSKPALYAWNAKLAAEYAVNEENAWHAAQQEGEDAVKLIAGAPGRYMREKGDLGTRVHHACENLVRGKTPNVDADVEPYLEQFCAFITDTQAEFVDVERTVFNAYNHGIKQILYAGTLDLVVKVNGERWPVIADIKTGGVYASSALQMCAYAQCTHMVVGNVTEPVPWHIKRAFVLDLKPKSYKMKWCEIGYDTWHAFLDLFMFDRWCDEHEKTVFRKECAR
jgi:hypothetical protein